MTDSVKWTTVATSIAAQSISVTKPDGSTGTLTIKDISAIPVSINVQDAPMLVPKPNQFITNMVVKRDSYGSDAALKSIDYDMTYQLFYCSVGKGKDWMTQYGNCVTCTQQIITYFATHSNDVSGAQDILPKNIPGFALLSVGDNVEFHGCEITFHVMQYLEV